MADRLAELQDAVEAFVAERDWAQFHTPKNLAIALSVEASELLEHFQWLTEPQSRNLSDERREAVALEMADVLLYLVRLADQLHIDLLDAADRKIALNARKYPVARFRGSARKYDE